MNWEHPVTACRVCGMPTDQGELCPRCVGEELRDDLRAALYVAHQSSQFWYEEAARNMDLLRRLVNGLRVIATDHRELAPQVLVHLDDIHRHFEASKDRLRKLRCTVERERRGE